MKKILLSSLLAVMAVTSANAKIASTEYVDAVAESEAAAAETAAKSYADSVAESKATAAETAAKSYTDDLTGDVVNSDYIKGLADKTLTGAVEDLDSRVEGLTGTGDQAAATNKELADGLATKLDKDQGVSNAGKGLIVDATGNLALADVATDAELATVSDVANNAKTIADGAVTVNTQQGTAISKNTTDIATNTAAIGTINSSDVMTSGATKAKIDAIATNTTAIKTLANGAVKDNADAIAAINNETNGVLKQAKDYTDTEVAKKQDTLSETQMLAVDSGATRARIDAIETNTAAIGTINSSDVMTSGATKAKIDAIATNTTAIGTINSSDVMTSGATKAKIDAIETNTAAIALNTALREAIKNNTNKVDGEGAEGTYALTAVVNEQGVSEFKWEKIGR